MATIAVAEAAPTSESAPQRKAEPTPRRKIWIYVLIVVLVVISFGYLNLIEREDSVANHDFYRVLYEASNKFNQNLLQLDRMHKSHKSTSTITSLLPSYTRTRDEKKQGSTNDSEQNNDPGQNASSKQEQTCPNDRDYCYQLNGQKLEIKAKGVIEARLDVEDLLPLPKQGFSRYLFADDKGNVLATAGDEKTISIVDLTSINREVLEKKRRFWLNLEEQQDISDGGKEPRLPSYSSHVDMQLSYGEFRIFMFPFSLENEIEYLDGSAKPGEDNKRSINKLYLVGLLPKQQLVTNGSGHWNVSLLLVTLVSLLFMWTLMRVYLLPRSQSITSMYRGITMVSSYGFYIVVIALVLAFMQMKALQISKDEAAFKYAEQLSDQLNEELADVFGCLAAYRPFYHTLIDKLDGFEQVRANNNVPSTTRASDNFLQMITKALYSIARTTNAYCNFGYEGLLPEYAWTPDKTYRITLKREAENNGKQIASFNPKLDDSAERTMLNAYQKNTKGLDNLAFMAGNLNTTSVKSNDDTAKPYFYSSTSPGKPSHLPSNIFTVFALNGVGNTTLPSIYYQENNAPPQTFNLSHRDYYKKVKDGNGWQLCLTPEEKKGDQCRFNNVYIQRLLNIDDGTRGTTVSMPMLDPEDSSKQDKKPAAYAIGADVILPSLSLAKPAPYDFTYMVVNRNNGDVLFHSDESRTLVENLFYAGNSKSNLSQWIKAGLDHYPEWGEEIIKGHYHGQAGRFALFPSRVEAWAIVVFYPDDSLDSLMTNQFLFISVSFAVALLILIGTLFICRHFMYTHILKNKLGISRSISGRVLVISGSILLGAVYSLHSIGSLFDLAIVGSQSDGIFSILIPGLGVLILLSLLFPVCTVRFPFVDAANPSTSDKGLKQLFAAAFVLAGLHLSYLHYAAPMPLKGLQFHYQQLHCNRLNYEHQETIRMGLSRFPNSITQQRRDPLKLLVKNNDLFKELQSEKTACNSQVEPDDYPNLSTLTGATYLWQWINTYLLNGNFPDPIPPASEHNLKPALLPVFGACILLPAMILGWLVFNRRILWKRFYCPAPFLQHIDRLTKAESTLTQDHRNEKLTIECATVKLNGIGLALLLRTASLQNAKSEQIMLPNVNSEPVLLNKFLSDFDELYQLSPYLQKLSANNSVLPNLKLNVVKVGKHPERTLLDVQIWDIETCLEKAEFRQHLLDLIMEIKSLTLTGQLNSFTIFTGFHSLQRVKMKDQLSMDEGSVLEHAEYLSWAECLMDFNVKVPAAFTQGLDKQFLQDEIADFPELSFLCCDEQGPDVNTVAKYKVWKARENNDADRKWWNTINYILLHADALYRFKWESCSNAEKLALFNLAKKQRLNPVNTQRIEHLALNGLIKVEHEQLEITNNSFAHFILNAETTETLNSMVRHSQEGVWKSYRLPLGLLVVLIIGGIALTSGQSLYIIAASVAGVLGTIAGVANSAHLLRGQIKA